MDWIRSVVEGPVVVALGADETGQGASQVFAAAESRQQGPEVVLRPPVKLGPRPRVDVHAIDARKHPPAAARVLIRVVGEEDG